MYLLKIVVASCLYDKGLLVTGEPLESNNSDEEDEDLWVIPLSFTSAKSRDTKLKWMPPLSRPENIRDLNVDADKWVIFNVNRSGM